MPNWVMNEVTVEGEEDKVKELFSFIKSKETAFDFNILIPMPESLNMDSGSMEDICLSAYLSAINPTTQDVGEEKMELEKFAELVEKLKCEGHVARLELDLKEIKQEDKEKGKQYLDNFLKYNSTTWYDWRIDNWGCKWNAADAEVYDNKISFRTPWSAPLPIFEALAQKFPDVQITCAYSEEQFGIYVGKIIFKNNKVVEEIEYEEYSKEAYELAAELWGIDLEEDGYKFDESLNTYVYVADDD